MLGEILRTSLRDLVNEKAAVIQGWIDSGQLAPVDPRHLIFMIWAMTQHYADFAVQIEAVLGNGADETAVFDEEERVLDTLTLRGLLPRG